jgi:hypothetical protein
MVKNNVPFTIASFDIGIKNLAFCVMQYEPENPAGKRYPILEWKNIDLTDSEGLSDQFCSAHLKSKKDENGNPVKCEKQAKLTVEGEHFCAVHNPDKKKYKIKKTPKAYSIPLRKSCVNLVTRLDEHADIWSKKVDHVIIETQYTRNRKMICQSDLLYSYFIMKHILNDESRISDVKFVSSRNKLKVYTGPKVTVNRKNAKDQRKLLAVEYCKYMIKQDKTNLKYLEKFPKKKDDLSDCFLQGAWYLKFAKHPKYGKQLKEITASK